ncbi:MAG: phosphatase PAP2 family protein [Gammaproteobacteria bacterium]|nr:phosphatase PAP2 family protein [Gammaproteobacteria bacterium]
MGTLKAIAHFDLAAFRWISARRFFIKMIFASRVLSHLGNGPYYLAIGLALFWFESAYGNKFLTTGLIAFAIELPLYLLIKNSIKRDRPFVVDTDLTPWLTPSDQFSFPSGHTAAAFVMAMLVHTYYPAFDLFAYLLASMIGAARIILGVHFPTDTLAGAALGTMSALIALSIVH